MSYPYIVRGIWPILEAFAKEFANAPYRYFTELDVHVALSSRIDAWLREEGLDTVAGNYSGALEGFEGRQLWARVSNAPSVLFEPTGDGAWSLCKPDIVVWDALANPDDPPDRLDHPQRRNWPMLWACEIKLNDVKRDGMDEQKMRYLIERGDVSYGCILEVVRRRSATSAKWQPVFGSNDRRLWRFQVTVPEMPR